MSDILSLNEPAPEFALPADDGEVYSLHRYRGRSPVLLFFYPGDFTPVCTAEVCAFRDDYHQFQARGVTLFGVSSDAPQRHQQFSRECRVPFRLLSDVNLEAAARYGAKGLLGMRRAYFFIDEAGILRWQHAELLAIFKLTNTKVLEAIDAVQRARRPEARIGESAYVPPPHV